MSKCMGINFVSNILGIRNIKVYIINNYGPPSVLIIRLRCTVEFNSGINALIAVTNSLLEYKLRPVLFLVRAESKRCNSEWSVLIADLELRFSLEIGKHRINCICYMK